MWREKAANIATNMTTAAIDKPMYVNRFITNLRQPYPRIEPPVNDVRQGIRDNIGNAYDQNAALNKAVIALCDAVFQQKQSEALPAEDLFRYDRRRQAARRAAGRALSRPG